MFSMRFEEILLQNISEKFSKISYIYDYIAGSLCQETNRTQKGPSIVALFRMAVMQVS